MVKVSPLLTSRKVLDVTYATPQETLLGTPETLPTTEPATPQVSYTVANSDLPSFSFPPYSKKYVAQVIGAGDFVTAGTLSWRMKKNGASVSQGSASVSANTKYTVNAFFLDVTVGDVLEIALWSNQTDSKYDYKAFFVYFTRLIPLNKPRLLKTLTYTHEDRPTLSSGNPSAVNRYYWYPYHQDTLQLALTDLSKDFESMQPKDTYGLWVTYDGDKLTSNTVTVQTDATYRPKYCKNRLLVKLVFRGVRLD